MKIDVFEMERMQSTWENIVKYNLSESGVHPLTLPECLSKLEIEELMNLELGYTQTNGTIPLRENIRLLYPGANLEQILVTSGSSEANYLLIWSLIEPGDEVLFELPNYMQMHGLLKAFQADLKTFYLKPELGWQPDLNELDELITSKTKYIILTNPNNPTGAILSQEAMDLIVKRAERYGIWVIVDEVYQGAELSAETTSSFWGRWERTITVNGLSKAYGLPGLRIGWIAGPEKTIKNIWPYHDYTTISPSALSDRIATFVLNPETRRKIIARTRAILNQNLPVLERWLCSQDGLFEFVSPQAGAICFARYRLNISSISLVKKLIEEKSVLIVPGSHFLMENFLRFGYGGKINYLNEALNLIQETLTKIKKS